jgi:uridine kinase
MVLVSIIGGSGAGKTSVTNVIFNHFNERAAVLSMDDYYKNLDPGTDPRELVPVYSMVTYRREEGICREFRPKPLIIVEGLLVMFKREMRDLFDFSIYIDAPADERLIRRIERDTKERGRSVDSIIEQYRKFVAPSFESFIEPQKYFCDIVLPDGAANTTGLNVIINAIENMLNK